MAWFQVSFFSECLSRSVPLQVLIPADSGEAPAEGGRLYKTLYLLHGYSGSSCCWLLNGQVNELSGQYDLAVVMMSGSNGFYLDQSYMGGKYSTYVGQELVSFTRKLFPLSHERRDTIIGGMSMGGYGALYNAFRYSGVFGHAISLGGTVNMDRLFGKGLTSEEEAGQTRLAGTYFGDLEKARESDKNPEVAARRLLESGAPLPELYLACGTDDLLCEDNRSFSAYLRSIGFPHIYEEGPGAHEWAVWQTYLERGVLRALAGVTPQPPADTPGANVISTEGGM
jgi:S-formylglutathione hydrolase FrmB